MAVYTPLSQRQIRAYLRPFRLGAVLGAKGIAAGTINTIYSIRTTKGRFILRILENRTLADARFEEALLQRLADREVPVAPMLQTRRYGGVVPIGPRQQLSVFEYMSGRELAPFELDAGHAQQIGEFLARMHRAARGLRRRRANRFSPPRIRELLARCDAFDRFGGRDYGVDIRHLKRTVQRFEWSDQLPRGLVHGDLFVDNVRFKRGSLVGVLDFEMASLDPLIYDLAVAICDWSFSQDLLDVDRVGAMLAGYQAIRPLARAECHAIFAATTFAAARYATTRFFDFEVNARSDIQRQYKDYRHFMDRLRSIEALGSRRFRELVRASAAA